MRLSRRKGRVYTVVEVGIVVAIGALFLWVLLPAMTQATKHKELQGSGTLEEMVAQGDRISGVIGLVVDQTKKVVADHKGISFWLVGNNDQRYRISEPIFSVEEMQSLDLHVGQPISFVVDRWSFVGSLDVLKVESAGPH
ncbi:MAG: hypothetical protein KDD64_03930 [Bdellovibrionales bacterium]|nr:hypothetical protein [Bdellovibrionales bacterium]